MRPVRSPAPDQKTAHAVSVVPAASTTTRLPVRTAPSFHDPARGRAAADAADDKLSLDGPRGLQEEARLHPDTGASRRGAPRRRVFLLHPEARGVAAPLRLPAGARRRPAELGRTEGPLLRSARQTARDARRGPPGRVRLVRRRDPGGRVRGRGGRAVGPGDLDARRRSGARAQERRAQVRAPRREARGQVGARQDQGRRPQGVAPGQGQGRARPRGGGAGHRERAAGERPERARPRRGGGRARPSLALEGGPPGRRGGSGWARRRRRGRAPAPRRPHGRRARAAPPQPAAGARDDRGGSTRRRRVAPRDQARRLSHRGPDRRGGGAAHLAQCEGLDEGVPPGRARRGPPAGRNRSPRRRGRRVAAERSDELPGAPAPRRSRAAARLLRIRPAAPRRLGPQGREAGRAQAGAAAPAGVRAGGIALQRSRARPGPPVLREGTRGRPRGCRRASAPMLLIGRDAAATGGRRSAG